MMQNKVDKSINFDKSINHEIHTGQRKTKFGLNSRGPAAKFFS